MGGLVKGDVVVVLFPFSDLSSAKKHPALVLATPDGDNVILCQITSRLLSDRHAILIGDGDFSSGSLQQESNIRPARIFTADTRIVQYVAGYLKDETIRAIVDRVVEILREK